MSTVTPRATIASIAASASKTGNSTIAAPRRTARLSTALCPKAWNSGSPPRTTSSARSSTESSSVALTCSTMARWEPTAPLGRPVVPEV